MSARRLKKLDLADSSADAARVWVTSYVVDESEAHNVLVDILERTNKDRERHIYLAFDRSGFRRASTGILPRACLRPVDVPARKPLASYHPKILLAESAKGTWNLTVSTGNVAHDDLRRTRNLVTRLSISRRNAEIVKTWIEKPTSSAIGRALCMEVQRTEVTAILNAAGQRRNPSTLAQFLSSAKCCPSCRNKFGSAARWIVAAPFWSVGTLRELLGSSPDAKVEAYFRAAGDWELIWSALPPAIRNRVQAFELVDRDRDPARWHHKLMARRCCGSPRAKVSVYVGSANATVAGFVGVGGRAINWEAGVLWHGSLSLWETAQAAALAGLVPRKLRAPKQSQPNIPKDDENVGFDDDELRNFLGSFLLSHVSVNRTKRTIRRLSRGHQTLRIQAADWSVAKLEAWAEESKSLHRLGRLSKPGNAVTIPQQARACLRGRLRDKDGNELPVSVDLIELDESLRGPSLDQGAAIRLASAMLFARTGKQKDRRRRRKRTGIEGKRFSDVRFPFQSFFRLKASHPEKAQRWLDQLAHDKDGPFSALPEAWRLIATKLGAADR